MVIDGPGKRKDSGSWLGELVDGSAIYRDRNIANWVCREREAVSYMLSSECLCMCAIQAGKSGRLWVPESGAETSDLVLELLST